ncbi:ComEC/Rec2 family competence protein [Candidatus Saccharibacteria bacterium]|nr:ComEC/Rec2 family competence protein [Candidatus Saccharibacteria bacterium]
MQLWQLRRFIHQSWLIALVSVGIVLGVIMVPFVKQALFGDVIWLMAGVSLAAMVLWRKSVYLVPFMILAGVLIGLWRGSVLQSQLAGYEALFGETVSMQGTVVDDVDTGRRGELYMRLDQLVVNNSPMAGRMWVSARTNASIKRGDYVGVRGVVSEGFGSFGAVIYRAELEKWQRPEPGDVARQVRDWFADKIRLGISEPQASLGLGYLLGQKRALPEDLQEALVVTGLTHVVVASGYNLTILVRLARRMFEKVSKYLAALSSSVMVLAFVAVTGASPSMSRAGLVAGLSLAAWYYGRKFHPLVLLPFAAAITVMINPAFGWNDLGWQLSFAAFAGVMILAPLLQRYFFGEREPSTIRQIIGETLSAHIVTLPILILAFGQIGNVAILCNVLILPFVPLAMLLTFITGIGAIVVPDIATILGMPAQALLVYMTETVQYFAALPWAQTNVQVGLWVAGIAYGVIVALCIYMARATRYDLKESNIVK